MRWRGALVTLNLLLNFICTDRDCTACSCCRSGACTGPDHHIFPCEGCIDGYTDPSCTRACPLGCINCSQIFYKYDSERICYHCHDGYYNGRYKDIKTYPIQQDCSLSCADNCVICSSYYNCISCAENHFLVNGRNCLRCPRNCRYCVSDTECVDCFEGYVWTGAECEQCPSNCKNCTSSERCSECKSWYYLHEGSCNKCPTGCLTCNGPQACDTCQEEYILTGNYCREKCSNCKIESACDNSTGYCMSCKEGLSGDTCDIPCHSNCSTCDRDNPETCIACSDDKYGSLCHNQCPPNCVSNACNDKDGACTYDCAVGYWGGQCDKDCPVNCDGRSCNRHEGKCSDGCHASYGGDRCDCPKNCKCDGNGNCTECLQGYGDRCDLDCSEGCSGNICERAFGTCENGCLPGYTGFNCSVTGSEVKENNGGAGVVVFLVTGTCILAVIFVAAIVSLRFRKSRIKEPICVVIYNTWKQLADKIYYTSNREGRSQISPKLYLPCKETESDELHSESSDTTCMEKDAEEYALSSESEDTEKTQEHRVLIHEKPYVNVQSLPFTAWTDKKDERLLVETGDADTHADVHSKMPAEESNEVSFVCYSETERESAEIKNTEESQETPVEISPATSENVLQQPMHTLKLESSSYKLREEKYLDPVFSLKSRGTEAGNKTDTVEELEVATLPKVSTTSSQESITDLDTGEVGMNESIDSQHKQAEPAVRPEEKFLDIQTKKSLRMSVMENQNGVQPGVHEGYPLVSQQENERGDKRGDILENVKVPNDSRDTTDCT